MATPTVSELITLSSRFTSGEQDGREKERLREIAERELPAVYRIANPGNGSPNSRSSHFDAEHLRGLWHELVQHLRDLRYLNAEEFSRYHQFKSRILDRETYLQPIVQAVRKYLAEDITWMELSAILPVKHDLNLAWVTRHVGTVTERISHFTLWDGSLPTPPNYQPGDQDIFGRSLAYRLRTLSSAQFPFAETDYFQHGEVGGLNELFTQGFAVRGAATKRSLPKGFWRHLGDIDLLLRRYIRNTGHRTESALLYQLPSPEPGQTPLADLPKEAFSVPRLDEATYDVKQARKNIRNARRREVRTDAGLDVRLLQIKLWQTGYYLGAVDGNWEAISHLALKTLIADEAELLINDREQPSKRQLRKAAKIRSLLLPANRTEAVYVADFKGILKLFDTQPENGELNGLDNAAAIRQMRIDAGATEDQFDTKVLSEANLATLYPNNVALPERRVAYSRRGIGKRFWGGVKKVFRWLKGKAVAVVEELLGPVFTLVKRLLRPIRMAITRFLSGFRYLSQFILGKPIFTEFPALERGGASVRFATHFGVDFNTRTVVPSNFLPGQAKIHAARLDRMGQDMDYFLGSIVNLLRYIGQLSQPGGWVWLGLKLFRFLPSPRDRVLA